MLNIKDIHTYYGNSLVLQGVNLDVEEHQIVALLGRNGVGKTTLVRSIMGLTPARRGQIRFGDEEITALNSYNIAQKGIGYVPQGRMIFPTLTVYENLMVAHRNNKSIGGSEWTVDRVLDQFPRLRERLSNNGNQLSGGEQQMLAIGRALVTNPSFLIMDEPTEGLAPVIVNELLSKLLSMLKEKGYTVLLVEQNLNFALKHADIVYIMDHGVIVYQGRPEDIAKDEEVKKKYLGIGA